MAITDSRLSVIMTERSGSGGSVIDMEVSSLDGENIDYGQLALVMLQLSSQFVSQALGYSGDEEEEEESGRGKH